MRKKCLNCGKRKDAEKSFSRDFGMSDGYQNWCKQCHSEYQKSRREKNKARHLADK